MGPANKRTVSPFSPGSSMHPFVRDCLIMEYPVHTMEVVQLTPRGHVSRLLTRLSSRFQKAPLTTTDWLNRVWITCIIVHQCIGATWL